MRNLLHKGVTAALLLSFHADAFTPFRPTRVQTRPQKESTSIFMSGADCACKTSFSGSPSEIARKSNPREVIRSDTLFKLSGEAVKIDDLIGEPSSDQVSIVVFLRSLG
jgi:hypothetical protein